MRRALVLAIGAVFVLGACGGGGGDDETAATKLGVALKAPAGWRVADDGLTAATSEGDLTAAVPSGPRVRVVRSSTTEDDLVDALSNAAPTGVGVAAQPARRSVAGRDALVMTLADADDEMTRRYVASRSPRDIAVLIILEAPSHEFAASSARLERIIDWTR